MPLRRFCVLLLCTLGVVMSVASTGVQLFAGICSMCPRMSPEP
jgi:hypothetical protein